MVTSERISITNYKNFRAVNMTLSKFVYKDDLHTAFANVSKVLNKVTVPIYIVIDLRNNSFMPPTDTYQAMISGPAFHQNLDSWIVIGENIFARYVGNMLERLNHNKPILWFESESDVIKYLKTDCLYA